MNPIKISLLSIFYIIGFTLFAQVTQIRGIVVDEENKPIENVEIKTQQGISFKTNSKGEYVFNYNVPMQGEVPKFKFEKKGYKPFIWEYDQTDQKKIVLYKLYSETKLISGKAINQYKKPLANEPFYITSGRNRNLVQIGKTGPDGKFKTQLNVKLPNKTYEFPDNIGMICFKTGIIENGQEKLNCREFKYNKTYENILWKVNIKADPDLEDELNNQIPEGAIHMPKAPEEDVADEKIDDLTEINEDIDEKHVTLDTSTTLSNAQLEELKEYIAYLETVLEQNDIAFNKNAFGQDSTIHKELKAKLTELKTRVAEKEKEVKKVRKTNWWLWLSILIIVLILIPTVLAIIFYRNNKKTKKLNVQLDKQNKELSAAYANITSSIQYAQRIQKSILVKPGTIKKHFKDSFVLYKPKDIVSGDFYWFTSIGDQLIITAVDCTGHGVPGAFMTMMGNSFLNEIINVQKITEPSNILITLHQKIQESLKKGDSGSNDGMDIALVSINKVTKKIKFAGANNPLLFVSNKELQIIKAERGGIGGTKIVDKLEFRDHEVDISNMDAFYLFSDGFQDQFGGTENRKFMKKRFKQILLDNSSRPFDQQEEVLNKALMDWKGKEEQTDDILVIGIKV